MKTSRIFMTTLVALTMTACSNDNDWVDQPSDPDVITLDTHISLSISISHVSKTRAISTDPGITAGSTTKSLHVFIYDAESPSTLTVTEFTVAGGTFIQKSAGSSTQITSQPVNTKKADKYIFTGVGLNAEIVNYVTSNGLSAFSYKDFTQEITKLADQANGFVMFNSIYPTLTPVADLYEKKSEAENNHIIIPVNYVIVKATVSQSQNFVVNGDGATTDLGFGWRNLNKKFYFIQDNRGALIRDYNWANYTAEDFTGGTDVINIYASADVPTSFSRVTESVSQYISGTSNVDAVTFTGINGVFVPTSIISAKINPPTVAADLEIIVSPKPVNKIFFVVRITDSVVNYFIDGPTTEKFAKLCVTNTPQMPSINGTYLLSENMYSNGLCYYHIFVSDDVVTPQTPYNIYRNQYPKININSVQASGNPSDNFDSGESIKPNSWIGIDIQIVPWEVIEEGHDLWPAN